MSEHAGEITASTPHARAVILAGLLAELAVKRVVLRSGPEPVVGRDAGQSLESRRTDLPGVLRTLEHWHLEAGALRAWGTPEAIRWATSDDAVAAFVRAAVAKAEKPLPPNPKP